MTSWISGVIMGVLSLIGLLLASSAVAGTFYVVGLLLFGFGVLAIFTIIHRNTGHPHSQH